MARTKYREHLQMIEAVQYDGNNLTALEEFAPGLIIEEDGKIYCKHPTSPACILVNVTDWLIDDPGIGFIIPITDKAFQCRFNAAPVTT
jgi:hypothetical protein